MSKWIDTATLLCNNNHCLVDRVTEVRFIKKTEFPIDIFKWKAIIPERDYELLKGSFTISFHGSSTMVVSKNTNFIACCFAAYWCRHFLQLIFCLNVHGCQSHDKQALLKPFNDQFSFHIQHVESSQLV